MFWICSRTWSISTFSSTAACEVRASTDLEPSVLASRLNSCSRKSRRRPTGSRLRQHAARLGDVAVEAVELLVDVELLQPQHQFLLEAARVERLRCRSASRASQLGAQRGADLRHQRRARRAAMRAMPSTRSRDAPRRGCAPSRSRAATKSASTWSSSASASACSASASVRASLQHAGELQQLGEVDAHRREARLQVDARVPTAARPARCPARSASPPSGGAQAQRRGRPCRARRAARRARAAPVPARAVPPGRRSAEFEEAMVDRAQLAAERAPRGGALAGGEGGHAADHAIVRRRGARRSAGRRMVI